jgi:hypothetical protein
MRFYFILSLSILYPGCSTSDPEEAVPEGPASAFHGVWKGDYKKLDSEGAKLKETTAKAEFKADKEMEGTFDFRFPEEDNKAKASGSYQIFNENTLIFEIKESSFSDLGLKGTVTRLDFELSGTALVLSNESLEMILLRDKDGSLNNDSSEDENDEKPKIETQWSCVDKSKNTWDLSIAGGVFNATVIGAGNTYFVVNGNIRNANSENTKAELLITESSLDLYLGRYLYVERIKDELEVTMFSPSSVTLDNFVCDVR